MLIGQEAEELVLDDGAAKIAAQHVAMQLRDFVVGGNIGILVEEERRGVEPAGAAMDVGRSVILIGARRGAHVNMRARRGTLLRVVHRGVDPNFLEHLRRRRGNRVADGEVDRRQRLNHAARAGAGRNAGAVDHARRRHLAGALAVEQVAGIHAVEQKAVRSVALSVGPDGSVSQPADGAGAAGEFSIHAGGENRHSGKASRGQGHRFDLRRVEHIAVGGVHGIHQRRGVDFDGLALGGRDAQLGIHGGGAVGLHGDVRRLLDIEAVSGIGQRITADGKIHKGVISRSVGLRGARGRGVLIEERNGGVGNDSA